jgi:hypothetical protein
VAILPLHPDGERLRRWLKAHRDELTLCLRRRDVPATNNASALFPGFGVVGLGRLSATSAAAVG